MAEIIEVIGRTDPPDGCEPVTVQITNKRHEPIEILAGCDDLQLCPDEALQLARLIERAALSLGAKERP